MKRTWAAMREGRYVRVWAADEHFRLGPFEFAEAVRIARAQQAICDEHERWTVSASGPFEAFASFIGRHWPAVPPRSA